MATLEQIQRGVDFIEAHLDDQIRLGDVAAKAGMSQWHFQRVFKALTHETLKTYIRSRRMANALLRLLETDTRIIEIALAAGFESQEAFTRAFQQAFGMTPHRYRKLGQKHQFMRKAQFTHEYLANLNTNPTLTPELKRLPAQTLVGMSTEYYGVGSEKNNIASKIPALWAAFLPHLGDIPAREPGVCYGVIAQTLDEDRLSYMAAAPVAASAEALAVGMNRIGLPAAEYAVFEHRGPVTELDHTVSYAYSTWLLASGHEHSGAPDLEIYGAQYHPTSPASVIYYALPLASDGHSSAC